MPSDDQPRAQTPAQRTLLERVGDAGALATSTGILHTRAGRAAVGTAGLLIVVAIALAVVSQATRATHIHWHLRPGWLLASLVALVLFQAAHAELWTRMLRALRAPIPRPRAWAIWSATLLARYIPGNLLLAAARTALAEREGVPKRTTLSTVVYEVALGLTGALIVSCYVIIAAPDVGGAAARFLVVILPIVALVAVHPRVFRPAATWVLAKLGRPAPGATLPMRAVLALAAGYAASFVLAGLAIYAFARGIRPVGTHDLPLIVASYAAGFAASVVAVILPGGIGARETVMVLVLSSPLGVRPAVAVAIGTRILQIGVELTYGATAPAVARALTRRAQASAQLAD